MMSTLIQIGVVFFVVFETVNFICCEKHDILVPSVGGLKYKVICQGKSGNLSCTNESMVMVIFRADYGRIQNGDVVCPYNNLYSSRDTNDKAMCKFHNVTSIVKPLCHKQSICDVPASSTLLGRPCKGVYKYLNIYYACAMQPTPTTPRPVTTIQLMTPSPGWQNGSLPFTRPLIADCFPVYVKIQTNTTSNKTTAPTRNATNYVRSTTVTAADTPTNATAMTPVVTAIRRRTPIPRSTDSYDTSAPYVKRGKQSNALDFGVSGRLLFWFLHFSANQNSYVAVFVVAALCAAVLFGIVFARCWYLRRRTKSQNFAVLHKPKRFFDPALDYKQSNGHLARRTSRDHEELLPDRSTSKTEVVVTRADVETSQPSRSQRNDGDVSSATTSRPKPGSSSATTPAAASAADEGDGSKQDSSTFYVNPMYDRNRQNITGSGVSAGSHPRLHAAHRLSNASEGGKPSSGRPLNKQQMRCNSMGNLPRSHHSSMQRRHPSAGNVASNKDGLSFDPLAYPPKGGQQYAPQMQPYQGQGQGNYQGQGQGNYQGQGGYQGQGDYQNIQRQPPGTPSRGGPGVYGKSPMTQRPSIGGQSMGSPAKAPQRNRPMGPGGVPYQSPGPPGRPGNRPNSPYEYGTTENAYPVRTDVPQWETSTQQGMAPSSTYSSSNGPTDHRSNGRLHRNKSYENIKPFDNFPDPVVHGEHRPGGYGKGLGKPTTKDQLISPLDSSPVVTSKTRYHAPPDQGSDSSDDDLYSLVAKGNYDSVINDPLNVHQTFHSKKPRQPVGSNHTGTRVHGRMFNGTSV